MRWLTVSSFGLLLGWVCLVAPVTAQWRVPVPGAARDIAITSDGVPWIIGTEPVAGGYRIFRFTPDKNAWTPVTGGALRIAVEGTTLWVVNSVGEISRLSGSQWQVVAGPRAVDVGASAKGVWITAEPRQGDNYSIYKWTGSSWNKASGAAVRVDVDADGNPWVVNAQGQVWFFLNNAWNVFPSDPVVDLSVDKVGEPWLVTRSGALLHFSRSSNRWETTSTNTNAVAVRGSQLWQLGANQEIMQSSTEMWAKMAQTFLPVTTGTIDYTPSKPTAYSGPTTTTATGTNPLFSGAATTPTLAVSLFAESGPGNLMQGTQIVVGGCFADPKDCRTVGDPYPSGHGSISCPIIQPGPPAIKTVRCEQQGAPAVKLAQSPSSDKQCLFPSPPRYGAAFYDPRGGGECWACPLGYKRTYAAVDTPGSAPIQACAGTFVWNLPQYEEPSIYPFLFDAALNSTLLLDLAISNPQAVRSFVNRRAANDPQRAMAIWQEMIRFPGDSPEFKALAFVALVKLLSDKKPDASINRFQEYVQNRRRFVVAEASLIYNKWKETDAFDASEALQQQVRAGGGLPLIGMFSGLASAGSLNANLVGGSPVDALGYAYASAVPDKAGNEFLKALSDLKQLAATSELRERPGAGPSETDFVQPLLDATGVLSAAMDVLKIDVLPESLSPAISILSAGFQFAEALRAVIDQAKADQEMRDAQTEAGQSIDLYQWARDKNRMRQLILYWALATSPHKGGPKLGSSRVTQTCFVEWQPWCDRASVRVAQVARAAGVSEYAVDQVVAQLRNRWVRVAEKDLPSLQGRVVAGLTRGGQELLVCRADMGTGLHPGNYWKGNNCHVGSGGKDVITSTYEVLTAGPQEMEWVPVTGGKIPLTAVVAGWEPTLRQDIMVCRANMDGGWHSGKLWRGACHVGYDGQEKVMPHYEVLVRKL